MRTILAATLALTLASTVQGATPAQHMPRGTATDISNADIQALIKKNRLCEQVEGGGKIAVTISPSSNFLNSAG